MERNGSYPVYANNVKQAIEALSEPDGSSEIPNDLEEASRKHSCYDEDCEGAWYEPIVRNAFIAGAKWQKENDEKELSEKIASAYQLGLADKEKQMVKEAVEGEVMTTGFSTCDPVFIINRSELSPEMSFKDGDKVRIIFV